MSRSVQEVHAPEPERIPTADEVNDVGYEVGIVSERIPDPPRRFKPTATLASDAMTPGLVTSLDEQRDRTLLERIGAMVGRNL